MITVPPTRTHRQLAHWVNNDPVARRKLRAITEPSWSSTDRQIPGSRLRIQGKGRHGVRLTLYPVSRDSFTASTKVYTHDTSETYRTHREAREWVENYLNNIVYGGWPPGGITARKHVNNCVAGRRHLNSLGLSS